MPTIPQSRGTDWNLLWICTSNYLRDYTWTGFSVNDISS